MSASLRQHKVYYNKLLEILQKCDTLGIELDAELVKSKVFDRLGLVLAGASATLGLLAECLQIDIIGLENKASMDAEFDRLYREEQQRFADKKRQIQLPPAPEEDDDESAGLSEGM